MRLTLGCFTSSAVAAEGVLCPGGGIPGSCPGPNEGQREDMSDEEAEDCAEEAAVTGALGGSALLGRRWNWERCPRPGSSPWLPCPPRRMRIAFRFGADSAWRTSHSDKRKPQLRLPALGSRNSGVALKPLTASLLWLSRATG